MKKVVAIVGLLGILLAIVGAFDVISGVNVAMILVVVGIIVGLGYAEDQMVGLLLAVLVYPVAAAALGHIPEVGRLLGAIMSNIGTVAAGAAITVLTKRVIGIAKASVGELTGKAAS